MHDLVQLLFSDVKAQGVFQLATFAIGAGLVGIAVVVADVLLFQLIGSSLLKLAYRRGNVFLFILFWGAGAAIVAYIASAVALLEPNRTACVTVGFSWPGLFPRILGSINNDDEEQKPTGGGQE